MLRRQGFRWKRTRYLLKKGPQPTYQLAVEQLGRFQVATQRSEEDLAYFDDSSFSVNPVLRYAWTRVGEQKAVFRRRHTKRFKVLGCLLHGELAWQGLWFRLNGAAIVFFMNERPSDCGGEPWWFWTTPPCTTPNS